MAKRLLSESGITQAKAIELLRLHNPILSFQGFADTGTDTPSHTANNAWIITESGTIFGVNSCVVGQVIYSNGSSFVVETFMFVSPNFQSLSLESMDFGEANVDTGVLVSSVDRVITKDYLFCRNARLFFNNNGSGVEWLIYYYDINFNYLGRTSFVTVEDYLLTNQYCYIRLMLRYNDDRTLVEDDIETLKGFISILSHGLDGNSIPNKCISFRHLDEYLKSLTGEARQLNLFNFLESITNENLYDKTLEDSDDITPDTYISTTGTYKSSTSFNLSWFIPVTPNTEYVAIDMANANYGSLGGFFSEDKILIGNIPYDNSVPISPNKVTFTTPDNCFFIRLNIYSSIDTRMLIFSGSDETYRDYGAVIDWLKMSGISLLPGTVNFSKFDEETISLLGSPLPWAGKNGSFVGDSITYGYDPDNIGSQIENNWVKLVGDNLGLANVNNDGINASVIAVNESDPTNRAPIVDRITSIDSDADLIVIHGGSNDYNYEWSPFGDVDTDFGDSATKYTFCGALDIICRSLISRYPAKQLVFITPIKRSNSAANSIGKTLSDYADAIIHVCGRYGIPVLDLYRNLNIVPSYIGTSDASPHQALYIPDSVHPNEDGHYRMAELITAFLNNLIA